MTAFFENLLPEGELRHFIAASKKASTLFSLLREVAGDTAGGFVLLPAGQRPQTPAYQPTSWEALAALLGTPSFAAIDLQGQRARISLSGAQDKAAIESVQQDLSPGAQTLALRLQQFVLKTTRQTAKRILTA